MSLDRSNQKDWYNRHSGHSGHSGPSGPLGLWAAGFSGPIASLSICR